MLNKNKLFYWLPRILSIGFVLFLSLFSLDVFLEYSGLDAIVPFLMHLIPSFVLLVVVIISWKYDLVGAIFFMGFAVYYIFMVGVNRPWSWYVSISGPAAIVAVLFFISWLQKKGKAKIGNG